MALSARITKRLTGKGRGSVVTPQDFLDLGTRAGVDQALSRLVKSGFLRRVDRGVYGYPQNSPLLGELSADPEKVAKALVRQKSQKLMPTGALSANLLGLCDQVPAKMEFLTDGLPRERKVKNLTIKLKRTTPKNLATAGRVSGSVIQALRYLGKKNVGPEVLEKLRQRLDEKDKRQLLRDIKLAPAWIGQVFRQLSEAPPPETQLNDLPTCESQRKEVESITKVLIASDTISLP